MNKFKYLLTAIAALTFISCGDGLKPDDGPDPAPEEKPVVKPDAELYSKDDKERLIAYMRKLNVAVAKVVDIVGNQ